MRLGIWCPAPLSIRPDAAVKPAFDALTRHGGGVDGNYLYAVDVLRRAEELGFEITLIAQRFFGPDLDSWMFASALGARTSSIEIMAAVHPGIIDPRVVAKHAASIDRISGGHFFTNIGDATPSDCVYFSFTTLTTIGYGDITASGNFGHTLSVTEGLVGQIYLVTIVSLLVGNLGRTRRVAE